MSIITAAYRITYSSCESLLHFRLHDCIILLVSVWVVNIPWVVKEYLFFKAALLDLLFITLVCLMLNEIRPLLL